MYSVSLCFLKEILSEKSRNPLILKGLRLFVVALLLHVCLSLCGISGGVGVSEAIVS